MSPEFGNSLSHVFRSSGIVEQRVGAPVGDRLHSGWPIRLIAGLCLVGTFAVAWGQPANGWAESPTLVTVVTAGGDEVQGTLIEIGQDGATVSMDSGNVQIQADELSLIRFAHPAKQPVPTVVKLMGGSVIRVTSVTWTGEQVTLAPARQARLVVPATDVLSIRFRSGNQATDPVWLGWENEPRRGDRLAVRRNEQALDSIDGTVIGVTPRSVEFQMGGNTIEAPLAKLEGVILSGSSSGNGQSGNNAAKSKSSIRVVDTSGSTFAAQSVSLAAADDSVELVISGSVKHTVSLSQLASIEYAGGVLALADAEIADSKFMGEFAGSASVSSRPVDQQREKRIQAWFAPVSTESATSESADLKSSDSRIQMNTPGEISFRVPDDYQRLVVSVRRSEQVDEFLPVDVEVWVDGQRKWNATLSDRQTLGLDLALADARRVTLKALPSQGSASGATADSKRNASDRDLNESLDAAVGLGGKLEWFSGRFLK
ncbi:glycosyl hydrolase family 98 [Neorhodopirellula lusitana]|uniref:glycosyl hydrolase family 98 n=1 Tax=Neorhodopirellula lusitana TaxID=445327 RepID=UPI00384A5BA6